MSICTISSFREAMLQPSLYFSTLHDIHPINNSITRSKHLVECRAFIADSEVYIYAPISIEATSLVLSAHGILATTKGALSNIDIYHNELCCDMLSGKHCSIFIEKIAHGQLLSEMIYTLRRSTLLRGMSALKATLDRYNISLGNLHPENIIVDDKYRWHPIRCYYVTRGAEKDAAAFRHIEEQIMTYALLDDEACGIELCEPLSNYNANSRERYPLCEERRRVMVDGLFGFCNGTDDMVIAAEYIDASDFVEGRAAVTTRNGAMGLIDANGREIIATRYDKVVYNPNNGRSWVCKDGLWAQFDYNGETLSEWQDKDECYIEEVSEREYEYQ